MEAKINKSVYVTAAVYIVLGLVMVIYPETTMKTFCLALGAIFAVLGIINLVIYFTRNVMDSVYRYDFVSGVMLILAGLMFIVKMDKIIELIPMILGVLILLDGVIKLQHAIDLKRIDVGGWIYVFVFSMLCLSVGTVCIWQPEFIASTIVVIMGISYIFCGITDFVTIFLLRRKMKSHAADTVVEAVKTETDTATETETVTEKAKWMFWKKDKEAADKADDPTGAADEEDAKADADTAEEVTFGVSYPEEAAGSAETEISAEVPVGMDGMMTEDSDTAAEEADDTEDKSEETV